MWNVFTMYNYWVWAQSRRSKSTIWVNSFWESIKKKILIKDDEKCNNTFTVN